jgi:hypothetical protein
MQDGYTSVLFSGVLRVRRLRTAIATVRSRTYGDSRGLGSFSFGTFHFALVTPFVSSMARSSMLFNDIHHYAGCSDSLGIIPCCPKKVGLVKFLCRPIPCRSALVSSFGLRSRAGRTYERLVQRRPPDRDRQIRHCPF